MWHDDPFSQRNKAGRWEVEVEAGDDGWVGGRWRVGQNLKKRE